MRLHAAFTTVFALVLAGCLANADQPVSRPTAVSQVQADDAPVIVSFARTDFEIPANPADELVSDFTYR
jgi:ABC-type enterochelin transport system substrate-binding protein